MTEHKLRPTYLETYIVLSSDVEMEDAPIFARSEGEEEEEEKTPKPKKKAGSKHDDDHNSGSDKLDSYNTPKAFKLKKQVAERAESLAESDVNYTDMSKADSHAEGATESESEDAPKLAPA